MVRAKIKSVEITEVPNLDPQGYKPDDPEDFNCTFCFTIGPADGDGGEQFQVSVCSPKWLIRECGSRGFVWGRHHLVVSRYKLEEILNVTSKFLDNQTGTSWAEVATKLARIAAWEFEDYRE